MASEPASFPGSLPATSPVAIILTGLPGSGKSTLAKALEAHYRQKSQAFYIISKDCCKSILLRVRDGMDVDVEQNCWKDDRLPDRLGNAMIQQLVIEDDKYDSFRGTTVHSERLTAKLQRGCATRLRHLAMDLLPAHRVRSLGDDVINLWSYDMMLEITRIMLQHHLNVILDAPLYRADIVTRLGDISSEAGAEALVFECFVEDASAWDDRLRRRKVLEAERDAPVKKPGSVAEVKAIYETEARDKERKRVDREFSRSTFRSVTRIETGSLRIREQTEVVTSLASIQSTSTNRFSVLY